VKCYICDVDITSFHPLFFGCNYDPSSANHNEDVLMSLNGFSPNLENNEPIPFKVGIKKRNYDAIRKFQDKWATIFPWVKLFIKEHGSLQIIKCKSFIKVKGKDKILDVKWDYFFKHASYKKALKNIGFNVKKILFYSKVCKHAKS